MVSICPICATVIDNIKYSWWCSHKIGDKYIVWFYNDGRVIYAFTKTFKQIIMFDTFKVLTENQIDNIIILL